MSNAENLPAKNQSDLKILNPLDAVRRHPEWYFRAGSFDTAEIVGRLIAEIVGDDVDEVSVARRQGWVVISADRDWLGGDIGPFRFPSRQERAGPNSTRFEVALTAFTQAVVTASGGRVDWISPAAGRALPPNVNAALTDWSSGRVVAFLPPAEPRRQREEHVVGEDTRERPMLRLLSGFAEKAKRFDRA